MSLPARCAVRTEVRRGARRPFNRSTGAEDPPPRPHAADALHVHACVEASHREDVERVDVEADSGGLKRSSGAVEVAEGAAEPARRCWASARGYVARRLRWTSSSACAR